MLDAVELLRAIRAWTGEHVPEKMTVGRGADAVTMVTQVRPLRRDETNACHRALPPCDPADHNRIITRETPAHEYATVATWGGAG